MHPDLVGEHMKRMRLQRGLSLRRLAADADVPLSTLSAVETGARKGDGLTLATARRITIALGMTLDHLFYASHEREGAA